MRYRAFLSYSHADEEAATRLHRAVERYVLPRRVQKAHALPRRLIPIFRDVDELAAASGLTTRLQDALDQSQWLIVLCSPAAAQSKYVNAEIEYFLQKHGTSRILCALAEGEPPECFPPALRALKEEPLAADFRPGKDFELSKLKLIAALAGVDFTELRSREAQRRKRQQLIAASLLVGIGLGGLAYWDLFHREHVDYYVNYVRRHGIWEGVDRISAAVASHRSENYRFTRRGRLNPPLRVDFVNGGGGCAGNGLQNVLDETMDWDLLQPTSRYCTAAFAYSTDGAIHQETLLNALGAPRDALTYTAPDLAQFTRQGFDAPSERSGVRYVQFVRDDAGLDREVRFLHSRGLPRANQRGDYGYLLAFDAAGRRIRDEVIDAEGKPTGEVLRVHYAPDGFRSEASNVDASGAPALGRENWATERYERDEFGNPLKVSYFGLKGEPASNAMGFAVRAGRFDERGNETWTCRFDPEGRQLGSTDGACKTFQYDDSGRIVRSEAIGVDGKPQAINGSASTIAVAYDARGRVTEIRWFDGEGLPAQSVYGTAIERLTHDERGNVLGSAFLTPDGKPALTPYGSFIRSKFDDRDNITEFLFLDESEKPYLRPDHGFACVRITRDERGNAIRADSFGSDLKPVVRKEGYATAEFILDDLGNRVEARRLDVQGRMMKAKDGAAIVRWRFDRLARPIEETYFDERQLPTRHKDGYFGFRQDYDSRNRETRRVYLDARGAPMVVPQLGHAGVRYDYDFDGHVLQEHFLGLDAATDVARLERRRDHQCEETALYYFDGRGSSAPHPVTGCAVLAYEMDRYTRHIAERCVDAHGRPTNRKDEGWALKKTLYEQGRIAKEDYFDAAGRPVKIVQP